MDLVGLYSALQLGMSQSQSLAGYLAASCGFTDSHLWSLESMDGTEAESALR